MIINELWGGVWMDIWYGRVRQLEAESDRSEKTPAVLMFALHAGAVVCNVTIQMMIEMLICRCG